VPKIEEFQVGHRVHELRTHKVYRVMAIDAEAVVLERVTSPGTLLTLSRAAFDREERYGGELMRVYGKIQR
jgi:hypothetical protein